MTPEQKPAQPEPELTEKELEQVAGGISMPTLQRIKKEVDPIDNPIRLKPGDAGYIEQD